MTALRGNSLNVLTHILGKALKRNRRKLILSITDLKDDRELTQDEIIIGQSICMMYKTFYHVFKCVKIFFPSGLKRILVMIVLPLRRWCFFKKHQSLNIDA